MVTTVALRALAVLEIIVGAWGAFYVGIILLDRTPGMAALAVPLFAMLIPLVVTGIGILTRGRWSYWLHLFAIPLMGLLYVLMISALSGNSLGLAFLIVALVVVPIELFFLSSPVRDYFEISTDARDTV